MQSHFLMGDCKSNKRLRDDTDHVKPGKKHEGQSSTDRFDCVLSDLQCLVCEYLQPIEIECLPLSYLTSKIQKMQQKRLNKRLEKELWLDSDHVSDFWQAFDQDHAVWMGYSLWSALHNVVNDAGCLDERGEAVEFYVAQQTSELALSRFFQSVCSWYCIKYSANGYLGLTKLVRIEQYLYDHREIQLFVADTTNIVEHCVNKFHLTQFCTFFTSTGLITYYPMDVLKSNVQPNRSCIENIHRHTHEFDRKSWYKMLDQMNWQAYFYGGGSEFCYTLRDQCKHLVFKGEYLCHCLPT